MSSEGVEVAVCTHGQGSAARCESVDERHEFAIEMRRIWHSGRWHRDKRCCLPLIATVWPRHRWDFEQSDLLLYVTQPTVEHFTISRRYCDTEGAFW